LNETEKPTEQSLGPAVLSFQKLWSEKDKKRFFSKSVEKDAKAPGLLILELNGREFRVQTAGLKKILREELKFPHV